MKNLIALFVFTIFLMGSPTDIQLEIADKYSKYFNGVYIVEVVENPGNALGAVECGDVDGYKINGCTYYRNDKPVLTEVNVDQTPEVFEVSLLHELAHNVFGQNERFAYWYPKFMIEWVSNMK